MGKKWKGKNLKTEGRVLNKAALIYDFVQPVVTLGQEKRLNSFIAKSLLPGEGDNIIDIGCGTGVLTAEIADSFKEIRITGIDASMSMIKTAIRKRGKPNCRFVQALGEDLPFENGSFDTAVSALFFHHINKNLKIKCLSEIMRILKPGGRVVIADMNIPYTIRGEIISYLAWKLLFQPEIRENMTGLVNILLKDQGFINIKDTGRFSGYITVTEAEKGEI